MFQANEKAVEQVTQGFNLLSQIEVKGFQNIINMANAIALLQAGIQEFKRIEEISNKEEDDGE